MEKKETGLTNLIVIIMSIIFSTMSALMIFVEGISIEYLIYAICVAVVIVGIVMIVRYFTKDAYKNINAYGFSIGTLLVILGICGLLRVSAMAGVILVILGMILLLAGIIMLQHSLDLYRMKDILRIPTIIVATLVLVCSIMAILQPFETLIDYKVAIWWMLFVSGILSLIINVYTLIKVKLSLKNKNKDENKAENQTNAAIEEVVNNTADIDNEETTVDSTASEDTEEADDGGQV